MEIGAMTSNTDMYNLYYERAELLIPIKKYMMVNGKMIKGMEKVSIDGLMEMNMKDRCYKD